MQVGNRVKIIKNRESSMLKVGDIGTITFLGGKTVDVDCHNGDGSWSHSDNEVELIEEQSIPERYKTDSIDVIDFCKIYNLNFNLGNIVKYVCRDKGSDIEDLEKVIDYAQREIKHLKSLDK